MFKNEVRIVADEITNAIVILATKRDYEQILKVLRDLDVVPRQVVIEVLIAEISLNKSMTLGLQTTLTNPGGLNSVPTTTPAPTATPTDTGSSASSLLNSIAQTTTDDALKRLLNVSGTGALTALITDQSSFRLTLTALAQAGRAEGAGEPAHPHRGQPRGVDPHRHGDPDSHHAVEHRRNPGRERLDGAGQQRPVPLDRRHPDRAAAGERGRPGEPAGPAGGQRGRLHRSTSTTGSPAFTTREAETTAVVQNGDSLLIGGMIQESTSRGRSGVPYLMDIPVLGRLFRVDTDTVRRIELIIMLTPHVIRSRSESLLVTEQYKDRLWDVVDEIERTNGLKPPSQAEMNYIRRQRSRTTEAQKPTMGVLPNRELED